MPATIALVCAVAFGFCVRTEPAVPSPAAPFDLVYEGHWPDTSIPRAIISTEVVGEDIRIRLDTGVRRGHYVQPAVTPFAFRVPADRFAPRGLPAGTYRVLIEVDRDVTPDNGRYEATFALVDVGAEAITPRAGLWRVVEPEHAGRPPRAGRDAGLRFHVDPRPDRVRVVAAGSLERVIEHATDPFVVAEPTWGEAWLRSEPRHVEGWLRAPVPTRPLDGTFRDRPTTLAPSIFIAIAWTDERNGILYLRSSDRIPRITSLPLELADGLVAPSDLARRWLLTRSRGDTIVDPAIVVLEEAGHDAAFWNYRDARANRVLRCRAVSDATAPCTFAAGRGALPAALVCGADGCDGQDARGLRVVLVPWGARE